MSGECSATSKFFIFFVGLVFWGAAAGLMYLGVEVYLTYQHYDQVTTAMYTLVPASILMGISVFMFILGLLGCIGGCKESKCALAVFFTILLVILLAEVATSVLGYVYKNDIEKVLENGIHDGLDNYTKPAMHDQIDYMQKELGCCGVHNYTDWYSTPWGKNHTGKVPDSCCQSGHCLNSTQIYHKGCYDVLVDTFKRYFGIIAGVAVAFAVIQILGMICSCIMMCRTRNRDRGFTNLVEDTDGYRA